MHYINILFQNDLNNYMHIVIANMGNFHKIEYIQI